MNFDPLLDGVYENGVKAAFEKDCGYDSFRVDRALASMRFLCGLFGMFAVSSFVRRPAESAYS